VPRAKETLPRDPAATQKRILLAAKREFARHGLGGARVDRIAASAKSNKRMLYHYFGNKDALFRRTLEDSYGAFRAAESDLNLEAEKPITALKRLMAFTWEYYLANPEFITLVNSENLHKAKHISRSSKMEKINRSFVMRMESILQRGRDEGVFRADLDAVHILITLAGLGYHYLNNRYTGAVVYGRNMMAASALQERGEFNISALLRIVCTPQALIREAL
jgi:AcrR family transcriptional regulator